MSRKNVELVRQAFEAAELREQGEVLPIPLGLAPLDPTERRMS